MDNSKVVHEHSPSRPALLNVNKTYSKAKDPLKDKVSSTPASSTSKAASVLVQPAAAEEEKRSKSRRKKSSKR